MSAKSRSYRWSHGKRRRIVAGAFGKRFIRKGGKARFGYQEL